MTVNGHFSLPDETMITLGSELFFSSSTRPKITMISLFIYNNFQMKVRICSVLVDDKNSEVFFYKKSKTVLNNRARDNGKIVKSEASFREEATNLNTLCGQ